MGRAILSLKRTLLLSAVFFIFLKFTHRTNMHDVTTQVFKLIHGWTEKETRLYPFTFKHIKGQVWQFEEFYNSTLNTVDRSRIHRPQDSPKLILIWNSGTKFNDSSFQEFCEVSDCHISTDRQLLSKASAVILWSEPWNCYHGCVPRVRYPYQLYISAHVEPQCFAVNNRWIEMFPPDYFNLSMTFKLDAQLPISYLTTEKIPNPSDLTTKEVFTKSKSFLKKKQKLVAWFVSSCEAHTKRQLYVQELTKYIPVDIYGQCGPLKNGKKNSIEGYDYLEENYKFYLSFENSFCEDYVTEKAVFILERYIVPVVMGLVNYTERAPPHSVINVMDFKSPKYLAQYLLRLDTNDTAYLEYFKWKAHYKVFGRSYKDAYCKLCSILNGKEQFISHKNYLEWWNPPGSCKNDIIYDLIKP